MILSNQNGTFVPTASGTGTFIGTKVAFDAVKATLPVNTVAYITDDSDGIKTELKAIVAASTDFTDFKTRIAAW